MKSFATSLVLLSAAAIGNANPLLRDRAACNADNCARAVTGTNAQPALTSRSADCQSFLAKTVQPAPVTVTSTTTNNIPVRTVQATTTIFVGDKGKRDAEANGATTYSASNVPSYASACSGTARYSSACSCFGITGSTTTRPASTIVYTETVTIPYTVTEPLATQTVTPGTRPACGSTVQGQGGCGCTYTVTCGAKYTGGRLIKRVRLVSEMQCVNECDTYDNCFNVDYNRRTGVCNIYNRAESTTTVNDDDAYAFAGTCSAIASGPDCRHG